jgi:multiple sugar transport system substrate-binding protein
MPPSGAAASQQINITYLTIYTGAQGQILDNAATDFTKQNPNIKVSIEQIPFGDLLSTILTRGATPQGPTIMDIYDMFLPTLVADGIAAKAPPSVAAQVRNNYPQVSVVDATKNGSVYGYPYEISVYGLLYNKQLFKRVGITHPPTNWSQTLADAKKTTGPGTEGMALITDWQNGTVHPFLSWAASNGVQLLKPGSTTQTELTNPKMVAVAQFYQELVKTGTVNNAMNVSNAESTGDYLTNFGLGKVGMLVMANWVEDNLISIVGSKTKFESMVGVVDTTGTHILRNG